MKYEIKGAYVPYLYAGICVRALFPKTAGLSTRSLLLAPRSWRLRARRGDALMRHEVSCLLDLILRTARPPPLRQHGFAFLNAAAL